MNDALIPVCGLLCLWPLLFGVVGFFIGKYAPRIRIETKQARRDPAGYSD